MSEVMVEEDAALMARFVRTRDRRLFEDIYRRYRVRMVSHARRFVKTQARAEELAQEIFVRVYTTKNYEPSTQFKTWLYRVATNLCLNSLRGSEHRMSSSEVACGEIDERADFGAGHGPEANLLGLELAARLRLAVDALPVNQRAALLLVRQDGLSHEEVAELLSVSVPAVKSLVHRALEGLRHAVARYSEDGTERQSRESIENTANRADTKATKATKATESTEGTESTESRERTETSERTESNDTTNSAKRGIRA